MKIRLRFIVVEAPAEFPVAEDGCAVMDIADGLTVDRALASLALPGDATYLTLVNDESIPVAKRHNRRLREGDLLTVFSPLKGG